MGRLRAGHRSHQVQRRRVQRRGQRHRQRRSQTQRVFRHTPRRRQSKSRRSPQRHQQRYQTQTKYGGAPRPVPPEDAAGNSSSRTQDQIERRTAASAPRGSTSAAYSEIEPDGVQITSTANCCSASGQWQTFKAGECRCRVCCPEYDASKGRLPAVSHDGVSTATGRSYLIAYRQPRAQLSHGPANPRETRLRRDQSLQIPPQ